MTKGIILKAVSVALASMLAICILPTTTFASGIPQADEGATLNYSNVVGEKTPYVKPSVDWKDPNKTVDAAKKLYEQGRKGWNTAHDYGSKAWDTAKEHGSLVWKNRDYITGKSSKRYYR